MNIIVCLDDKNGMLFNKRRQSRDAKLCKRILEAAGERPVLMNSYSAKLFEGATVTVDEYFLGNAREGDICFVENTDVLPFAEKIESITVYRWNRVYPADTFFPLEELTEKRKLLHTYEFEGKSHERITEEVYGL